MICQKILSVQAGDGNRYLSEFRIIPINEKYYSDSVDIVPITGYIIAGSDHHFVYSWRLDPTDKLPLGKKPCLSLRELEKQIGYDPDSQMDPMEKNITVEELVQRYLMTKTGVKHSTLTGYKYV